MKNPKLNLSVEVTAIEDVAENIRRFELSPDFGVSLPKFSAGAHITIETPSKERRDYSLINSTDTSGVYSIAVKREADGDGGSRSMHDHVKVGAVLRISSPRNYFELAADAQSFLLIAGGIGITPILAMARQLTEEGRPFRVIYLTRSEATTAFADELRSGPFAGRAQIHHDQGKPENALNLAPMLDGRSDGLHLYCCGPLGLMKAVRGLAADWPPGTVHFEDFGSNDQAVLDRDEAFEVELGSSGSVIEVAKGETIVQALERGGVHTATSCESGTCGTCMTKLLSGDADHRDLVLSESEKKGSYHDLRFALGARTFGARSVSVMAERSGSPKHPG